MKTGIFSAIFISLFSITGALAATATLPCDATGIVSGGTFLYDNENSVFSPMPTDTNTIGGQPQSGPMAGYLANAEYGTLLKQVRGTVLNEIGEVIQDGALFDLVSLSIPQSCGQQLAWILDANYTSLQ